MQVAVTDYKISYPGKKVTIDTEDIVSIFDGNGVFDGRSMKGWNVVLRDGKRTETVFINNEDVKQLRTAR